MGIANARETLGKLKSLTPDLEDPDVLQDAMQNASRRTVTPPRRKIVASLRPKPSTRKRVVNSELEETMQTAMRQVPEPADKAAPRTLAPILEAKAQFNFQ